MASETYRSPAIGLLARQVSVSGPQAVDAFWDEVLGGQAPLTEPDEGKPGHALVTFLWRADKPCGPLPGGVDPDRVTSAALTAPVLIPAGGMPPVQMTRLAGTDLWSHTESLPEQTCTSYWFEVAVAGQPGPLRFGDPANPQSFPTLPIIHDGRAGLLMLPPGRRLRWSLPLPDAPQGKVEHHAIRSSALGMDRDIHVYLPFRIPESGCRLAVLFDGSGYIDIVPGPVVLDNLHASGTIPPTIAVMVQPASMHARNFELWCNPLFARFVAEELVPWLRDRYPLRTGPSNAVVGGFSLGGLAAGYTAMRYPETFGNVLAQSGAFWRPVSDQPWGRDARAALAALGRYDGDVDNPFDPRLEIALKAFQAELGLPPTGLLSQPTVRALREQSGLRFDAGDDSEWEWYAAEMARRPRLPLRFHLGPGLAEGRPGGAAHPPILWANRHLRDVLTAKGYPVSYYEHPGGHDPACWSETLADGLIALLASEARQ